MPELRDAADLEDHIEDLWKEENQGVTIKELLQNVKVNDLRNNKALRKYIFDGEISGSEWADMIEKYLPEERLDIKFKVVDEDTRILIFKPYGKKYEDLCEDIL